MLNNIYVYIFTNNEKIWKFIMVLENVHIVIYLIIYEIITIIYVKIYTILLGYCDLVSVRLNKYVSIYR